MPVHYRTCRSEATSRPGEACHSLAAASRPRDAGRVGVIHIQRRGSTAILPELARALGVTADDLLARISHQGS